MTVVGADQWADAPTITLGTSSAYTPNTGYGTETGEPSAWGGRTAWWKYTATESQFVYVDVLHSTGGPVRSWSYRADGPAITDLFQVSAPTAGAQGGFNANAGSTYYIRIDSDGTDASYVLSVGADVYDYHTERRLLTTPDPDPAGDYIEDYFNGTGQLNSGPGKPYGDTLVADHVEAGNPNVLNVGAYASAVIDDYPTYAGDDWYALHGEDVHPALLYTVQSEPSVPFEAPTGFELVDGWVKAAIWTDSGIDIHASGTGEVQQLTIQGDTAAIQSLYYFDDNGGVVGDVPGGLVGVEHRFAFPATLTPGAAEFYYNDSRLRFGFNTNRPDGTFPAGSWFVGLVAVEFLYQSEEPVPYVPPGPPDVVSVAVLRRWPRDDAYGFGNVARNYPPPRRRRNYGQQP